MDKKELEIIGDNHFSTNIETPLRANAFDKSDNEKIENIQFHFGKIMEELRKQSFFKGSGGIS